VDWLKDPVATDKMIAPADLELFRMTDDNDQVVKWIEESFMDASEESDETSLIAARHEAADAAKEKRNQRHRCPD
jgi:hypothetical protein